MQDTTNVRLMTPISRAARICVHCLGLVFLASWLWSCDYARMSDDEAVDTYQTPMPEMPQNTVPVDGGYALLKEACPKDLQNPLPLTPQSITRGRESYQYYCIHCHGPEAEGYGTVGQSFSPLPTNLKGSSVQGQGEGELFYKISFGYKRHPPLYYTVSVEDRWAVVCYIRSLAGRGLAEGERVFESPVGYK